MNQQSTSMDVSLLKNRHQVLTIAEGFFHSAILFALLKLKVFDTLSEGSKTLDELAAKLKAKPETLARLLKAGVALKLLECENGSIFRVAAAFKPVLLPTAGETYMGDFIRILDRFQLALVRLDQAVAKSGPTVEPEVCVGENKDRVREFTLAMHSDACLHGKELANFLDTTGCESLLDLGCGPGTYAFHLGMRNPRLRLFLLDQSEVLEVAKEIQSSYSIKNEVHYLPVDVLRDEIPGSYDLILVSNTLHLLGEQASRKLIGRCYRSINRGGSLVIQAQYLEDSRPDKVWPIFLDLIALCMTPEGRNHSVGETRRWLQESGFSDVEFCPMTLFNSNGFLRGYKT